MSHIKQPKWSIPTQNQMPVLMLQNSLTRKKEPLITKDKSLTWYSCGPTVYDKSHLGHARNYIAFDIQRRILEKYFGYNVTFVMNITDVDDKIILNARREFLLKNYLKTADNLRETCQKAWDYYCEKYFKLTSPWPEFVEKVNAGSVTSDDVKFSLYFKTAVFDDNLGECKKGLGRERRRYNSNQ
jgi:cysteinyl-tRNA synthetase